jgi:hypothetical protein
MKKVFTLLSILLIFASVADARMYNRKLEPETLVWNAAHPTGDWRAANQTVIDIKYQGISKAYTVTTTTDPSRGIATVGGGSFITNVSTVPWELFPLRTVTIYDGTYTAIGYSGAVVGTVENLGNNVILNNADFTTDEPAGTAWIRGTGWTILGGVASNDGTGSYASIYQNNTVADFWLMKSVFDVKARTSGSVRALYHGGGIIGASRNSAQDGYKEYITLPVSASGRINFQTYGTFVGSIDNPVYTQVLTPNGPKIYSAKGGATQSFMANPGINANATSLTVTVLAGNYNQVTSGSYTAGNGHISLVDGTAFADIQGANFSAYGGGNYLLCATDSSNRTVCGYMWAGTGETLSSVLNVSNCENSGTYPYEDFSGSSSTGYTAENTTGWGIAGTADEIPYVLGALFKSSYTLNKSSGNMPASQPADSLGAGWGPTHNATEGSNVIYFTATKTTTGVYHIYNNNTNVRYVLSSLAVTQVTVPSTSGSIITTTKAGGTFNWPIKDPNFDPNAAGTYVVYQITP